MKKNIFLIVIFILTMIGGIYSMTDYVDNSEEEKTSIITGNLFTVYTQNIIGEWTEKYFLQNGNKISDPRWDFKITFKEDNTFIFESTSEQEEYIQNIKTDQLATKKIETKIYMEGVYKVEYGKVYIKFTKDLSDNEKEIAIVNLGYDDKTKEAVAKVNFEKAEGPYFYFVLQGVKSKRLLYFTKENNIPQQAPYNQLPSIPLVTSLFPAKGPIGTKVKIIGSGFSKNSKNNIVTLRNLHGEYFIFSGVGSDGTTMTFIIPDEIHLPYPITKEGVDVPPFRGNTKPGQYEVIVDNGVGERTSIPISFEVTQ